ncbi:MAG: 30S ribosomal protein S8 [Nanoarchaeota archaeon]
MSEDVISDVLNQIMNAKRTGKKELVVQRYSKLLLNILNIAQEAGYLTYSQEGKQLKIDIGEVHTIKAINPRFTVSVPKIDGYVRRYLPAKNFGFLIVSTSKGLMRHDEAEAQKIGGCLVAYVY